MSKTHGRWKPQRPLNPGTTRLQDVSGSWVNFMGQLATVSPHNDKEGRSYVTLTAVCDDYKQQYFPTVVLSYIPSCVRQGQVQSGDMVYFLGLVRQNKRQYSISRTRGFRGVDNRVEQRRLERCKKDARKREARVRQRSKDR